MRDFQFCLRVGAIMFLLAAAANVASAQVVRDIYRDAIMNRPTVSPYLSLFNPSGTGTTSYHSYVRPLLEQQRANRAADERLANLQVQLNQQSARTQASSRTGISPTGQFSGRGGRADLRMYYSHYFPTLNRR